MRMYLFLFGLAQVKFWLYFFFFFFKVFPLYDRVCVCTRERKKEAPSTGSSHAVLSSLQSWSSSDVGHTHACLACFRLTRLRIQIVVAMWGPAFLEQHINTVPQNQPLSFKMFFICLFLLAEGICFCLGERQHPV